MKKPNVSGLLFAILSLLIPVATSAQPSTQPCCVITAIDARSGLVTARDMTTGTTFQFTAPQTLLPQLRMGQKVWVGPGTQVVSVEGAPNCCRLTQLSQPPGDVVLGARPKLEVQPPMKPETLTAPRGAPLELRKPQIYDLAITAIGSTLQKVTIWYGSTTGKGPAPYPGTHHVLETMLKNNGNQTIRQAGVECTLRGPSPSGYVYPIMFSSVSAGTEYKPGESRPFSVRSPGSIGAGGGIPRGGSYSVACTARIVQPSGVTERNTANNSLAGQVSTPPPSYAPSYDIAITAIGSTLRETTILGGGGGLPVGTHTLLEATVRNNGASIAEADVECTLGALTFRRSFLIPPGYQPGESHTLTVYTTTPLSQIPSGPQSVACTARIVYPFGVTESNTANNTLTGTVSK